MSDQEAYAVELEHRRYVEELLAYAEKDGGNLDMAKEIAAELRVAWSEYEAIREVELGRADRNTARRLAEAFGVSEPRQEAA